MFAVEGEQVFAVGRERGRTVECGEHGFRFAGLYVDHRDIAGHGVGVAGEVEVLAVVGTESPVADGGKPDGEGFIRDLTELQTWERGRPGRISWGGRDARAPRTELLGVEEHHGGEAAVAFDVAANLLHRLDVAVLPVPQIEFDFIGGSGRGRRCRWPRDRGGEVQAGAVGIETERGAVECPTGLEGRRFGAEHFDGR